MYVHRRGEGGKGLFYFLEVVRSTQTDTQMILAEKFSKTLDIQIVLFVYSVSYKQNILFIPIHFFYESIYHNPSLHAGLHCGYKVFIETRIVFWVNLGATV